MTARAMAPFRWLGGKGNMVAKIRPLIPAGKVYVEPYFGAGSIFWNIDPFPCEVINDLNGDIVNLMRCLQDEDRAQKLHRRFEFTLYSVEEFCLALETLKTSDDPDARAWAFYVAQNQGFGGIATARGNWGRVFLSRRGMAGGASQWWSRFDFFPFWHQRLARAQIDNRPALEIIKYWDSRDTVFYLDPPYALDTRKGGGYRHEMLNEDHAALIAMLPDLKGQFVLSGYDSPIYEPLDEFCSKKTWQTACHAAGRGRNSGIQGAGSAMAKAPRTEIVWIKTHQTGGLI